MLISIELWNFKSVEHSLTTFGAGLTALKGANEAGKSTRYHAVGYAFFGARSLPLSLAETVTWGKPESSLKVRLVFTYSNNEYVIERSKAGASLFCKAQNLLVSGQAEVTKYVEGLFGINADTASKLTVASQNSLRGALEDRSAVPLIEKLANINLIDTLISKAQETLPSGNTKFLEQRIEQIGNLVPPVADFAEEQAELDRVTKECEQAKRDLTFLESLTEDLKHKAMEGEALIVKAHLHKARVVGVQNNLKSLEQQIAVPIPVMNESIEELERLAAEQLTVKAAQSAYATFKSFKPEALEPYNGVSLAGELKEVGTAHTKLTADLAELKSDLRVALMGKITDKECKLCGKQLLDVEEVVAKNALVDKQVEDLNALIAGNTQMLEGLLARYKYLSAVTAECAKIESTFSRIESYVTVDNSTVPPVVSWNGATVEVSSTDFTKRLKAAKEMQTAIAVAKAQRATSEQALNEAKTWLAEHGQLIDTSGALADKAALAAHFEAYGEANKASALLASKLLEANNKLGRKQRIYENALSGYEAQQAELVSLQATIKEYAANNQLIKRLREARPVVAAELWTVVLTTVSRYFSEIRGTKSSVTVQNSSFLIDGKPSEAYSGSTLDSLGLAIRMALAKTFLPNLDFLLLDEPASGMDDEREAAMLGVLAAANFSQVVVVTHSTIADSFAAQIIQI